jgi:hypothetical protein
MKKLLTILAIAGVMAACNSGNDENKNGDSSTMSTGTDTSMNSGGTTMGDTSHMGDSSHMMHDSSTMKK